MKEEHLWLILGASLTYLSQKAWKYISHKLNKKKYERQRNSRQKYY